MVDRLLGVGPVPAIIRRIPLAILVNPFLMLFSFLLLIGSIPVIFGHFAPQSVELLLPGILSQGWAAMVFIGALLQLTGSFMAHRRSIFINHPSYIKGQELERIGLLLLGWMSTIYSLCVIGFAGLNGVEPAFIILAYAGMCFIQAYLIRSRFTLAYHVALEYGKSITPGG